MPRRPRLFLSGCPSHVRIRGIDGQEMFRVDADRLYFLACLRKAAREFGVAIHAYVLMTNHVHLMVSEERPGAMGLAIQSLGRRYVAYWNRRNARTGPLWEGRHRSSLIGTEAYVFKCYQYIEQNPVRAAMVRDAADYPWSSHGHNAFGNPDDLVAPHALYTAMGANVDERLAAYRAMFGEPLTEKTLAQIRDDTRHGWALGDEAFHHGAEKTLGQGTRRRPRGWAKGRRRKPDDENKVPDPFIGQGTLLRG